MAGLDIKTPFDDDGHTLHDGALQRFFHMRKWFFVVGVLLLLVETGWWDFQATASALAVGAFPKGLLHAALTITGAYLLVQAALVATQIVATYAETVRVRRRLINAETEAYLIAHEEETERRLRAENADFDALVRGDPARIVGYPGGSSRFNRHLVLFKTIEDLRETRRSLHDVTRMRAIIASEAALDILRILPTLGFLAYAVVAHGNVGWLFS